MDGQRTGSAKKYLPYHNVLILHKSKKQTVKDQFVPLCNMVNKTISIFSVSRTETQSEDPAENENGNEISIGGYGDAHNDKIIAERLS